MIDSHFHYNHLPEKEKQTVHQTSQHLEYLINISTSAEDHLSLPKKDLPDNILFAAGLYPELADKFSEEMKQNFLSVISSGELCAVGETGLDYFHNYSTPEKQKNLFKFQIKLSSEFNLPLIIHSRDAFDDTMKCLYEYQPRNPVIFHCFSYGPEERDEILKKGYFISFAGNLTFKKASAIQNAAKDIPLNRILFETDSPYLAPVPKRGKNNQPVFVEHTYRFFSELYGIGLKDLEKQVSHNFKNIFSLK